MQEEQVQKIFTQLVGAVSYVHSKSCVHRDLKLENILLDKHGNVKLVDFGFTREYQGTTSYLQTWCGTVCYSAPEMLKGEKYAGEKVDVWSLGIILYALLCGELPFDEDDENETKQRILKEDPKYPDYVPEGAIDLLSKLLSRRPLLRPPLADVLRHAWLQGHAPQQQEILKVLQPPPFSTEVEKATLQRMRSAGVNIDHVIENVLGQRCDPLAGWWGLLLEKEERKERRRLRKRREREAEARSLRRLSASSSRLLNAPSLREITEEEQAARLSIVSPKTRGRGVSRSSAAPPDLPRVTEGKTPEPEERPPPPVEKDQRRRSPSITSSSCGPALPPKDVPRRPRAASRTSSQLLQVIHTKNDLLAPPPFHQKLRKRPFKDQLAHLKSWFKTTSGKSQKKDSQEHIETQLATARKASMPSSQRRGSANDLLTDPRKSPRPDMPTRTTYPVRPRISTASSYGSTTSRTGVGNRPSLSPAPVTPRSSIYRRSSGLRGRKSTSSSVSSVRSIHTHHHSLSRASTTSSNSVASPSLSTHSRAISRSPHTSGSVVILPPSTPTSVTGTFPSGIRVARHPPPGNLGSLPTLSTQALNSPMSYTFGPASPGMHPVFAKKKRSVFKGPSLGNTPGARGRGSNHNSSGENSRGTSAQGRRSNEITITEEDEEEDEPQDEPKDFFGKVTLHDQGMRLVEEDEEEDLEVEEVESFSPIEEGDTTAFIIEEEEEDEDPDADVTVIPNLGEDQNGVEAMNPLSTEMSRDAKTIAEDVLSRSVVEGEERHEDTSQGLGISGAVG